MKVHLNDIDVSYIRAGAGKSCVLIHGLAEDAGSWQAVQAQLSDFETFAYDFRGHGATKLGLADGTLAQLGGDLIAFLEDVTGPAPCVGYSLGGTIVLWAAAQRPDLIPHAVVTGTSPVVGRTAAEFFDQRIEMIQSEPDGFAAALSNDTAQQLVNGGDLVAITRRRLDAVGNGGGYINGCRAMAGLRDTPLMPMSEKIFMPVDVIGGDKDVFCPKKAADILCGALANATYHEIPDAGHLISIDQPRLYATAIEDALTRRG